jgi:hypothetical protein
MNLDVRPLSVLKKLFAILSIYILSLIPELPPKKSLPSKSIEVLEKWMLSITRQN